MHAGASVAEELRHAIVAIDEQQTGEGDDDARERELRMLREENETLRAQAKHKDKQIHALRKSRQIWKRKFDKTFTDLKAEREAKRLATMKKSSSDKAHFTVRGGMALAIRSAISR